MFSKKFFRLIVGIIIISQVISLKTVLGFASTNNDEMMPNEATLPLEEISTENVEEESASSESEHTLVPIIATKKGTLNECVEVSFDNTGVTEYYYAGLALR